MLYKAYKQAPASSLGKDKGSGNKSLQWAPGIDTSTFLEVWHSLVSTILTSALLMQTTLWHWHQKDFKNSDLFPCNFVTRIFGMGVMMVGISTVFPHLLQREITALATSISFNSKGLLRFLTANLSSHSSLLHLKQTKACANCHWSMGD